MIEIVDERPDMPDAYTRTGLSIWYREPERTVIDHDELVAVLGEQYRYSAHFPVSLLFHSWVVAEIARILGADVTGVGYAAIHDCHEVYCHDQPRGLKAMLLDYQPIERGWAAHVHASFGYPWPPPPEIAALVKRADRLAVPIELRLLKIDRHHPLYVSAVQEIGDDDLLDRVYDEIEERAALLPWIGDCEAWGRVAEQRTLVHRWQSMAAPHLPAFVAADYASGEVVTAAACVIGRLRAALVGMEGRLENSTLLRNFYHQGWRALLELVAVGGDVSRLPQPTREQLFSIPPLLCLPTDDRAALVVFLSDAANRPEAATEGTDDPR